MNFEKPNWPYTIEKQRERQRNEAVGHTFRVGWEGKEGVIEKEKQQREWNERCHSSSFVRKLFGEWEKVRKKEAKL